MANKELNLFSLRSCMILLFVLLVTLIPFGLRLRFIEFVSPVGTWHRLTSVTGTELFAQFRLELLVIITIIICIVALLIYYYEHEKGNLTEGYVGLPVIIFAFLVVLSGLISPYINVAFWGYYDRAEGSFAYLSYLIIFIVAANFINGEKDKKIIVYAAITAGILQSLIAISQFFGMDVLQTKFAMHLYITPEYHAQIENIQFRFANKAYGTTFNPNYLGGYMSMILPMIFVMFLYAKTKKQVIIWAVVLLFGLVGFFAPTSIGAFISVGLTAIVIFILTKNDFKRYYRRLILAIILITAVGISSDIFSGGSIMQRVTDFYTLNITRNEIIDEELIEKTFTDRSLLLPYKKDLEIEIKKNPLDSLGSGRYYIWRKSIEMIKNKIIIGHGLDTFVYNFPHWDSSRNHDIYPIGLLIDKPHNTYIQIGTGIGGIGLIVYLFIMVVHYKKYISLFKRRGIKNESDLLMLALFTGWLGYLFQGLSNDSVLSNAPVFWVLFGLSVNYVKNAHIKENIHQREVPLKKRPSIESDSKSITKQKYDGIAHNITHGKEKKKSGFIKKSKM